MRSRLLWMSPTGAQALISWDGDVYHHRFGEITVYRLMPEGALDDMLYLIDKYGWVEVDKEFEDMAALKAWCNART